MPRFIVPSLSETDSAKKRERKSEVKAITKPTGGIYTGKQQQQQGKEGFLGTEGGTEGVFLRLYPHFGRRLPLQQPGEPGGGWGPPRSWPGLAWRALLPWPALSNSGRVSFSCNAFIRIPYPASICYSLHIYKKHAVCVNL